MKAKHIVFVHGLFGWGPDEVEGLPYWGDAIPALRAQLERNGRSDIQVHEASCGPVSSFHDRACEIFAQLRRTTVDYGAEHAATAQHRPIGVNRDNGVVPSWQGEPWSADNPVIFIAHSAGAHTCLQLQQLLADDFWHKGTNAHWIEAVICVSGVLNGSTLTYRLGCDKKTGKLNGVVGDFIGTGVQILGGLARGRARNFFNWDLDQWIDSSKVSGVVDLIKELQASHFAKGQDNLAYDMTLKGAQEANQRFKTQPDCYYLSVVTEQTSNVWPTDRQAPTPINMNLALWSSALYQGALVNFGPDEFPLDTWGTGDLTIDKWRENDGAVSSISQRYPFTGGSHPVGGEGIVNRDTLERGKWYHEKAEAITGKSFDHLDVVFGHVTDPTLGDAHRNLYRRLADVICRLA